MIHRSEELCGGGGGDGEQLGRKGREVNGEVGGDGITVALGGGKA